MMALWPFLDLAMDSDAGDPLALQLAEDSGGGYGAWLNAVTTAGTYPSATQEFAAEVAAQMTSAGANDYRVYFDGDQNRVVVEADPAGAGYPFKLRFQSSSVGQAALGARMGFALDTEYESTVVAGVRTIAGDFHPQYVWSPQCGLASEQTTRTGFTSQTIDWSGGAVTESGALDILRRQLGFEPLPRWRVFNGVRPDESGNDRRNANLESFWRLARPGTVCTFFDHRRASAVLVTLDTGSNTAQSVLALATPPADGLFVGADIIVVVGNGCGQRRRIVSQIGNTITPHAAWPNGAMTPVQGSRVYLVWPATRGVLSGSTLRELPAERLDTRAEFYRARLELTELPA